MFKKLLHPGTPLRRGTRSEREWEILLHIFFCTFWIFCHMHLLPLQLKTFLSKSFPFSFFDHRPLCSLLSSWGGAHDGAAIILWKPPLSPSPPAGLANIPSPLAALCAWRGCVDAHYCWLPLLGSATTPTVGGTPAGLSSWYRASIQGAPLRGWPSWPQQPDRQRT